MLTRLVATLAVWGAAFALANKGSDYLANKGAQQRVDNEDARNQRIADAKRDWISQGGNPDTAPYGNDPRTNFQLFFREWEKAQLEGRTYRIPASDLPQSEVTRPFTAAADPRAQAAAPPPPPAAPGGQYVENSPDFPHQYRR